jgi:ribokinase
MRLVVLGDLMVDVVARMSGPLAPGSDTPARIELHGGGSGANVAAWAASLGVPVSFVGRVGDDERGRNAVAALAGVDACVTVDAERPTGTCLVLVEPGGERTMVPDPGANDGPLELPERLLQRGAHLHVSGYALLRDGPRPGALAAVERARAAGMTVSIDPASWALLRPGLLPEADLLLPNAEEAKVLTGVDDPDEASIELAGRGEVVVKLGADGAIWRNRNAVVYVDSLASSVIDTTGAGDAFAAGLLAARLSGDEPKIALWRASRAAARAVAQPGARPA